LVYSLTTFPTEMTISPSTGLISWTPSSAGSYNVNISVTDGTATVTQSYSISVSAASQSSTDNNDLFIDSIKFVNDNVEQGGSISAYVTVENKGNNDINDLELTMSIGDLGIEANTVFDIDSDEKVTKEITLYLPSQVTEGFYTVKLTFKNDDINAVRYREVYVMGQARSIGNQPQSNDIGVVFTPSISSYVPTESKSRVNWTGVSLLAVIIIALFGVAVYLIRTIAKPQNKVTVTELDEQM
jgi:hypothetical protein